MTSRRIDAFISILCFLGCIVVGATPLGLGFKLLIATPLTCAFLWLLVSSLTSDD